MKVIMEWGSDGEVGFGPRYPQQIEHDVYNVQSNQINYIL
jgi:hypothetical protein